MTSATSSRATGKTFRSFRSRNYRLWFVGQGISQVGFWVQLVAQALLVLELSGSGLVLGFATALQFLPILLVGPWAGVLSDRLDKRRLLLATQASMMLTAVVLGVLVLTGWVTLSAVLILAGLTGTAFAFDQPARRTIVTELVDDSDAANAVSLNGAVGNAAKILGPAFAGLLISTIGVGWCFILNGASSVAVLVALLRMDAAVIRRPPTLLRTNGQIADGFRYVWSDASVRLPLLMLGAVGTVGFNWNVLLPMLVTGDLGGTAGTYGVVMGVMSVGSLSGSLWLARRDAPADARFIARGCAALGATTALLAVTPTVLTAAIAAFATGASAMVLFNGSVVRLQLGAKPEMRGRVMAMFSMVFLGSHAVGGPMSGWIADRYGARTALALGAAAALAIGAGVLVTLRRGHVGRDIGDPAARAVREMSTAVEAARRRGSDRRPPPGTAGRRGSRIAVPRRPIAQAQRERVEHGAQPIHVSEPPPESLGTVPINGRPR